MIELAPASTKNGRAKATEPPAATRHVDLTKLISVLGTILGLAVGGGLGWALVVALRDQGMSVLSLPARQLVTIAIIAAVAGVVAAIRPSRRAARIDVLEAIATD